MIYFTNILLLQIYFFFGMVFVSKRFFFTKYTREDSDKLPVGLLAQLVERWPVSLRSWVQIP